MGVQAAGLVAVDRPDVTVPVEVAAGVGGTDGLDLQRRESPGAPSQGVRPFDDAQALRRVGADVGNVRIHPRRPGGESAGAVDKHADLIFLQAADRRFEVDRTATHRRDPFDIPQKLGRDPGARRRAISSPGRRRSVASSGSDDVTTISLSSIAKRSCAVWWLAPSESSNQVE